MKTRLLLLLVIPMLMIVCVTPALGARTIPASNETNQLTVVTSAAAIGSVTAHTTIVYTQGNGNLTDNPPLESGEGQSTIAYTEDTLAVNGAVTYDKYTNLDTGNQGPNGDNLETERIIEYSAEGDGQTGGRMLSSEEILVDTAATGTIDSAGCCPWGSGQDQVLPANNDIVVAGSTMDVTEASVASTSGARTTSSSVDTPVELTYSVNIQGINQTPGDMNEAAQGSATAYVSANLQEGLGNETAKGTDVQYSDVTSASGLFDLAKEVSYTSG
ncbi:hypothetical protein J2741_001881 [Methanolinea mesophila]|uniref:hypothetical protein n=1 Tax=Methanolinea mesophila TaxID=547055 RepID=UPI001AE5E795|nr:hypothetical protein [Methanolinea mesophila]MBP1929334.1 hypothetical protein [Methanolinea mesophila]